MDQKNVGITEIIAAAIAGLVIAIESDAFSLRHTIIGAILVLLVIQGFNKAKSIYTSILFSSVFALITVLAFGILIDLLRNNVYSKGITRDSFLMYTWLLISAITFGISMAIENKKLSKNQKSTKKVKSKG